MGIHKHTQKVDHKKVKNINRSPKGDGWNNEYLSIFSQKEADQHFRMQANNRTEADIFKIANGLDKTQESGTYGRGRVHGVRLVETEYTLFGSVEYIIFQEFILIDVG